MLVADGLNKHFGGLHAIRDVSLHGDSEEILGVIGPNGAGKSTLFNLVTGVHDLDSGQVRLDDNDLTAMPAFRRARHGISRTFQLVHVVEQMRVVDNVMLGLLAGENAGFRGALQRLLPSEQERQRRERATSALGQVGLSERADTPASRLSYGERRLLEVARATVGDPPVLLLDEPAAGLNAQEATQLAEVIAGLRRPGRVILLVEHNVPFVMRLCDRIVVLNEGTVLAEGTPAEIQSDGAVVEAYLGSGESA